MTERFLHGLNLVEASHEDLAATRERLRDRFPRGATRRMTQLGLLVSSSLDQMAPMPEDTLVYASGYGETCALEGYLESFPTPSPTLFQTSIHPSAVQQAMIGRQCPVGEFLPITGRRHLVGNALLAALISPAPRVLLCAGEDKGTWLLERGIASDRSFALVIDLRLDPSGAIARFSTTPVDDNEPLTVLELGDFHDLLRERRDGKLVAASGLRIDLAWR